MDNAHKNPWENTLPRTRVNMGKRGPRLLDPSPSLASALRRLVGEI